MSNLDNKIFEKNKSNPDVKTPEYIGFSKKPDIGSFKEKILKNKGITKKDISNMMEEIKSSKISVFGQEMTKEELGKISKEDIELSKKILNSNANVDDEDLEKLTYLFPDVLNKIIIKRNQDPFLNYINLPHLKSISDEQIKIFAMSDLALGLFLTTITDKQAEYLSTHKKSLYLCSLVSITDKQAEYLSKHRAELKLNGLVSITDKQAESFSEHQGDLYLNGITLLTNDQAKAFSKTKGYLSLMGLTMVSETQYRELSSANNRDEIKFYSEEDDRRIKLPSLVPIFKDNLSDKEIKKIIKKYKLQIKYE